MKALIEELERSATPQLDDLIDAMSGEIDLFHELEKTEQDPQWHGEGNVLIHTRMVLDETYAEIQRASITGRSRAALVLTAALHDIAKPLVTRRQEFDGVERIISPRHADRGRSYLAPRLLSLGLEPSFVFEVLALVGHHHDPLRLMREEPSHGRSWRLARLASSSLLYHFEVADLRGRLCDDLEDQLDMLELYRLEMEDAGVEDDRPPHMAWRGAIEEALDAESEHVRRRAFAQALLDAEAGLIRSPEEAVARSYRHREQRAELTVLCGPSGSGKSSWTASHAADATVISLDELRVELAGRRDSRKQEGQVAQEAKRRLKEALARGDRVVWDATCLSRNRRGELCRLGFDYGAFVSVVAFVSDAATLRQRNAQREHPVPTGVLERQLGGFDLPYADEAHQVRWHGADGEPLLTTP